MAEIPVTFATQFGNTVLDAAQQKVSRLYGTVGQIKTGVVGSSVMFDTVGTISMSEVTTRHSDTDYGEDNYGRRRALIRTYSKGVLVDEEDDIKTLLDPRAVQTRRLIYATARRWDQSVIDALEGTADVVASASDSTQDVTATALPTAQKITTSTGGWTLAKLLQAKRILDSAEVDDSDRYHLLTSYQLEQALAVTQVGSADYNTVKALVQGDVNTFAGFMFKRTELLTHDGTSHLNYCYQADALGLGVGMQVRSRSDVLPTKNYSTGVHVKMSYGCVRVEDKRVVQIACAATL